MTMKSKSLKSFCLKVCYLLIALSLIYVFWDGTASYADSNYNDGVVLMVARADVPEGAEADTDLPGGDYKNFDLKAPKPELCKRACDKDPKCRAYTYVKPGIQGKKARCWLKSGVPTAKRNKCCISGVKSATGVKTAKRTGVKKHTTKGPDMVPQGSYMQSCNNINISGTTLSANCRTKESDWRKTSLKQIDLCRGDISNFDGFLTCEKTNAPPGSYLEKCVNINVTETSLSAQCVEGTFRGKIHWYETTLREFDRCVGDIGITERGDLTCEKHGNVPTGSYLRSCMNPSVISGTNSLTAICRTGRQMRRTTLEQIDLCRGDIGNYEGFLTCEKTNAPPGTYLESCVNINVSETSLSAYCRNELGGWWPSRTTLERFDLCVGDISNKDGYLTCPKRVNVPVGSYANSCFNATVSGTTLTAICKRRDGINQPTTLEQFDSCVGDISNNNGRLSCNKN